jgi:hypothetical protein
VDGPEKVHPAQLREREGFGIVGKQGKHLFASITGQCQRVVSCDGTDIVAARLQNVDQLVFSQAVGKFDIFVGLYSPSMMCLRECTHNDRAYPPIATDGDWIGVDPFQAAGVVR